MLFATARRFGLFLAGARAGGWRWLIAAAVASLVAVLPAAAAARTERVPAVTSSERGPLARAAFTPTLARALVKETRGRCRSSGWIRRYGLGPGPFRPRKWPRG